jgi:hypothetical protein
MLCDLTGAVQGQTDLGLGNGDEVLSTVTKENKCHSYAQSLEDKLMSLYEFLQCTVPLSKPINFHLATLWKFL